MLESSDSEVTSFAAVSLSFALWRWTEKLSASEMADKTTSPEIMAMLNTNRSPQL
jgi:hypothetical protein